MCKFGVRETASVYLSTEGLEEEGIVTGGVEGTLPLDVCAEVCLYNLNVDAGICYCQSADVRGAEVICVYGRYC